MSLSVLLSFRNCQGVLAARLPELIESLPDLTPNWELILVDDASRDASAEIAEEYARQYPQVRLITPAQPRGRLEALRTALLRSRGDYVLIPVRQSWTAGDGLHRMWAARHHLLVLGVSGDADDPSRRECEIVLVQRPFAGTVIPFVTDPARIPLLAERFGRECHLVRLFPGDDRASLWEEAPSFAGVSTRCDPHERTIPPPASHRRVPRSAPAFLRRLTDFALGE
ncbi:glycosyltransferase family 2 protein [Thermopirellula anaerolimosa]